MSYQRDDVISVVYRPPTKGQQRLTKPRPMVVVSTKVYHKVGSLSAPDLQGVEKVLRQALGL